MQPPLDLRLAATQTAWNQLEEQINSFVRAWDTAQGAPPAIACYVPTAPLLHRKSVLVELIKIDMENRWTRGKEARTTEQYVEEFPELADENGVPCDLLLEEYMVRRKCGDNVSIGGYLQRFPNEGNDLFRLLYLVDVSSTPCVGAHSRFRAGDTLEEFILEKELGRGTFATVFLAWQTSLQRHVALKMSEDRGDESRTLAQLQHPHVVGLLDARRIPERQLRFIYMEYLPGGSVQDAVRLVRRTPVSERAGKLWLRAIDRVLSDRGEPIPHDSKLREEIAELSWSALVCRVGAQVAMALHYLHGNGVLHRDLKPANILLTNEGVPKLVDFNVSFSSQLNDVEAASYFGGSLAYMSPEQLEAYDPYNGIRTPDDLDGRSDLYSLGVVLWELISGHRPFPDERLDLTCHSTLKRLAAQRCLGVDSASRRMLRLACPSDIQDVVESLLDPDPDRRPLDGAELARRLQLCASPNGILKHGKWKKTMRDCALVVLLLLALLPHGFAAEVCFAINKQVAIPPSGLPAFNSVRGWVNPGAFLVGVLAWLSLMWPVVRRLRLSSEFSDRKHATASCQCLGLGFRVAALGISLWLMAGCVYASLLSNHLEFRHFVIFVLSHLLGGLFASAYSFLGVTAVAIRIIYPKLLESYIVSKSDLHRLTQLSRSTRISFSLAVSVPLMIVVFLPIGADEWKSPLTVAGMIGFFVAGYQCFAIERDIAVFRRLHRPLSVSPPCPEPSFTAAK